MENIAYINDTAYSVKPGETILSFVRRYMGKDFVPPSVMHPTSNLWILQSLQRGCSLS
jgi:hypothetical protein